MFSFFNLICKKIIREKHKQGQTKERIIQTKTDLNSSKLGQEGRLNSRKTVEFKVGTRRKIKQQKNSRVQSWDKKED